MGALPGRPDASIPQKPVAYGAAKLGLVRRLRSFAGLPATMRSFL